MDSRRYTTACELHLFDQICTSQRVTKIGRNIFLLLDHVDSLSLILGNHMPYISHWFHTNSLKAEINLVMHVHVV